MTTVRGNATLTDEGLFEVLELFGAAPDASHHG